MRKSEGVGSWDGSVSPPGLADEIRNKLNEFTVSERKVAQTLLGSYPVAGLETVVSFAKRANVSTATVLRFINRLGFSVYADFQSALLGQLENNLQSPLSRMVGTSVSGNPLAAGSLQQYITAMKDNLDELTQIVPQAIFENVVELLMDRRRSIYIIGGRYSRSVAMHLSILLEVIRPRIKLIDGPPQGWPASAIDLNRWSVVIVFDTRRYQDDLRNLAATAKRKSATVVLITDPWYSEVAGVADYILPAPVMAPSLMDSFTSHLALVECLIATCAERLRDPVTKRLEELEELRDAG